MLSPSIKLLFFCGISLVLPFSWAYALQPDLLHNVFMFENTLRRDGTFDEAKSIVYMSSGCTGFFVKNKNNKPYIMTARHCYNYNFTQQCQKGLIYLYAISEDHTPHIGRCQNIIASSALDDAVIFEAQFEKEFYPPLDSYSLAGTEAPTCSKAELIGFPADPERQGRFTVSENCWTQPSDSLHAEYMFTDPDKEQEAIEDTRKYWEENPDLLAQLTSLSIKPGYHNCSVYGGNSGGPLKLAGQKIAIGLPFQYLHVEGTLFSADAHTVYESLDEFVNRHHSTLKQHGISIVDQYKVETVKECGINI